MAACVITGGSRGMGRATALKFAGEGHDVALTYRVRQEEAEEVVRRIEALGRRGLAVRADVGDPKQIDEAFDRVEERFGKIDYLFNNVGMFHGRSPLGEQSWEGWQRLLSVNVIGQWYCTRRAVENMVRHGGGGAIVYNSSISGVMTFPLASDYAASKHAVVGLARAQALECARHGIRVNVICPGFFRTDLYEQHYDAGATADLTRSVIPAERIAEPEEVAELVYWLMVRGTYCYGSTLVADGGITAGPKLQEGS